MSSPATKRQLIRAFDKQHGKCCYCDGDTWLPGRETKDQARDRLGIQASMPGSGKMLIACKAMREHLVRRCDGGKNENNIAMACHACNVRRHDSTLDVHRIDMQVMVAAGLHPTNRPRMIDDPRTHIKLGLKALRKLRRGMPIEFSK